MCQCIKLPPKIERIKSTLDLTLMPVINVIIFLIGLATVFTLFSGFADYRLMLDTWTDAPILQITTTNTSTCPQGSTLLTVPLKSGSSNNNMHYMLSKWRAHSICITYGTINALARTPVASCTTLPLCGGVACLPTCALINVAVSFDASSFSIHPIANTGNNNNSFPMVRLFFSNETSNARALELDSLTETQLFADNAIPPNVPRQSKSLWKLYYLHEVPWQQGATCSTPREALVQRQTITQGYTTTQYLAFAITVMSVLLLAIAIPICLLLNGKLKQIWKPTEYEQEIVDAKLAFQHYAEANPQLWQEYGRLLAERHARAARQRDRHAQQQHHNHNHHNHHHDHHLPTPPHLLPMEQVYTKYKSKTGAKSCIDCSQVTGMVLGTLFSVCSFVLTIVALVSAFQVKDFFRLVANEHCGDAKTNQSIDLLANSMGSTTTWLNMATLAFSAITMPIAIIGCLINLGKYCVQRKEEQEDMVENKLLLANNYQQQQQQPPPVYYQHANYNPQQQPIYNYPVPNYTYQQQPYQQQQQQPYYA